MLELFLRHKVRTRYDCQIIQFFIRNLEAVAIGKDPANPHSNKNCAPCNGLRFGIQNNCYRFQSDLSASNCSQQFYEVVQTPRYPTFRISDLLKKYWTSRPTFFIFKIYKIWKSRTFLSCHSDFETTLKLWKGRPGRRNITKVSSVIFFWPPFQNDIREVHEAAIHGDLDTVSSKEYRQPVYSAKDQNGISAFHKVKRMHSRDYIRKSWLYPAAVHVCNRWNGETIV